MIQPKTIILLVDDDQQVLAVTEMQLESLGHKVVAMLSGQEALAAFQADPTSFDLVITDGRMPEIPGTVLAESLLSIRSDIPIVLCTGFSPDFTPEMARKVGCRGFVMKPMCVGDWSAAIRHVLRSNDFYTKG